MSRSSLRTPPRSNADPTWIADPTVVWNIGLSAVIVGFAPDDLQERLDRLNHELDSPSVPVRRGGHGDDLLRELLSDERATVLVGLPDLPSTDGTTVLIAAHHSRIDGLGLLGVLDRLTDVRATSNARGVAERPSRTGTADGLLGRVREVLLTPPDVVPSAGGVRTASGDRTALRTHPGRVHTSDLVHATTTGVGAWSRSRGGQVGRPVIAVGAARIGGQVPRLGNHSALLRLPGTAGLTSAQIRRLLAESGSEPEPPVPTGWLAAPRRLAQRVALRALRGRLGSTALVSHLGTVHAPGLRELALYPVTGGGSGLSVGAVTLVRADGSTSTTLTARGRAARQDGAALSQLLDHISADLP